MSCENSSRKRRKADSLGRIAESTDETSGRGAATGWTTCPLCGTLSRKRFALGRGIASHLHAVHTPWKPGKLERTKRRRLKERQQAESKRQNGNSSSQQQQQQQEKEDTPWDPSPREVQEWDQRVLEIVKELEENSQGTDKGLDRSGNKAKSYRQSLPPFLQAAADGNLDKLKEMVHDSHNVLQLLNTNDRHLSTAEHWAAGGGHLECLQFLMETRQEHSTIERQPSQRRQRRRDGKTCLHYAARNGHLHCIQYLLQQQRHVIDERTGDGTTPLHLACFGGHVNVVRYLQEQGADVKAVNEWGCSAAHWASMTQNQSEVRPLCHFLKRTGVSFVEPQNQGHTALHKAAQRKNRPVIEWMSQTTEQGGAGLSNDEQKRAGQPDHGGHIPSEIWTMVGGEDSFSSWMQTHMGW